MRFINLYIFHTCLTNISNIIGKASDRFLTIERDKDIFLFKSSDTLFYFQYKALNPFVSFFI